MQITSHVSKIHTVFGYSRQIRPHVCYCRNLNVAYCSIWQTSNIAAVLLIYVPVTYTFCLSLHETKVHLTRINSLCKQRQTCIKEHTLYLLHLLELRRVAVSQTPWAIYFAGESRVLHRLSALTCLVRAGSSKVHIDTAVNGATRIYGGGDVVCSVWSHRDILF